MGKQNPFENWRVKAPSEDKEVLLPPNSKTINTALGLIWQAISTVILAGIITATLFSLWMPSSFIPGNLGQKVADVVAEEKVSSKPKLLKESCLPIFQPIRWVSWWGISDMTAVRCAPMA